MLTAPFIQYVSLMRYTFCTASRKIHDRYRDPKSEIDLIKSRLKDVEASLNFVMIEIEASCVMFMKICRSVTPRYAS